MIWHRGAIVPDENVTVPVLDRALEHGIGLFETFRTWGGLATALDLHLERLDRSARALGVPFDHALLPDRLAVSALIEANRGVLGPGQDARLRITLSGSARATGSPQSRLWMTARTLPPDLDRPGAVVDCSIQVSDDDPLARHKTLNYWRKSIALADGAAAGSDDVLCVTPSGLICETCRANIFVIQHGRLHTPPLEGPLLPGVMRELVIRCASAIGLNVEEATVLLADVQSAEEVFLTNAVRGIVPVSQLLGREFPAPGPITADLRGRLLAWLFAGGSHG